MTISILKLSPGQKIARPFSRSTDLIEMREMVAYAIAADDGIKRPSARCLQDYESSIDIYAFDTEQPIYTFADGTKFFAFTE